MVNDDKQSHSEINQVLKFPHDLTETKALAGLTTLDDDLVHSDKTDTIVTTDMIPDSPSISIEENPKVRIQCNASMDKTLEEITMKNYNQLVETRSKLETEMTKNKELENKLKKQEDSSKNRISYMNDAIELAQSELKDCQDQLGNIQSVIPSWDAEIDLLRDQLNECSNYVGDNTPEKVIKSLEDKIERLLSEKEQVTFQLNLVKSELNETLDDSTRFDNSDCRWEKIISNRVQFQQSLYESQQNEKKALKKVDILEKSIQKMQQNTTKLESEGDSFQNVSVLSETSRDSPISEENEDILKQQVDLLEKQLVTCCETLAAEKESARFNLNTLWKKEKELSDTYIEKQKALGETKMAEEKIKLLKEEKKKLTWEFEKKQQDDENKLKKLSTELEDARAQVVKESLRYRLKANSAQRALTQANERIEKLEASNLNLLKKLGETMQKKKVGHDQVDDLHFAGKTSKKRKYSKFRKFFCCF